MRSALSADYNDFFSFFSLKYVLEELLNLSGISIQFRRKKTVRRVTRCRLYDILTKKLYTGLTNHVFHIVSLLKLVIPSSLKIGNATKAYNI